MEYGQLCWPFSFMGIVPAGDHPHLDKMGSCDDTGLGTANIGRVA